MMAFHGGMLSIGPEDVLIGLLVVMAVPPILAAAILWRFRHSDSAALRERAWLALILAVLAVVTAILALNRLLGWGISGAALTIPFATVMLLVDLTSGRWLWKFWTGGFEDES